LAAAAPAPAAAPSTAKTTPTPSNTNPAWEAELPSVAKVKQAITGTDTADTAARQEAAFATLADYVESRNGGIMQSMSPSLGARFREYSTEQNRTHPHFARIVSAPAGKYFATVAFRRDTITKLISPAAFAAYEASSSSIADVRVQEAAASNAAAAKKSAAGTQALVMPSLADAKKHNVDTSVFGVALGMPLALPACAEDQNSLQLFGTPSPPQTCVVTEDRGFFGIPSRVFTTGSFFPDAPGLVDVTVRLGESRCPAWADCSLVVATKDGYAMAVTFLTRYGADKQAELESLLSEKYHHAPTDKSQFSECSVRYGGTKLGVSDRAANRMWDLPGLLAGYIPYGSATTCDVGAVRVQLGAYTALLGQQKQREHDAQPKM